jgi:hypothetical protein
VDELILPLDGRTISDQLPIRCIYGRCDQFCVLPGSFIWSISRVSKRQTTVGLVSTTRATGGGCALPQSPRRPQGTQLVEWTFSQPYQLVEWTFSQPYQLVEWTFSQPYQLVEWTFSQPYQLVEWTFSQPYHTSMYQRSVNRKRASIYVRQGYCTSK